MIATVLGASRFNSEKVSSTCVIGKFCVFTEPDNSGNVLITMHSYLPGWVAIGTGVHLGDAMIVAWRNTSGGMTISDRMADGVNLPPASENMISEQIPTRGQIPTWAKLSVSVIRPIQTDDVTYTPYTSFVWAVGKKQAYSPDDRHSSFPIHEEYGHLGNLDLTTRHYLIGTVHEGDISTLEIPDNMDYITIIRIHGFFMIYAWLACPLVGVYIARYLKDRLGHYWFIFHVTVMVVGTGFGSLAGIMIIYLFKAGSHFLYYPSAHPFLGLLVSLLLIVQCCLGIVSDRLFSMDRTVVPWWDKAHWYLGRLLSLTAVAAIVTGILYSRYFFAFTITLPVTAALVAITGIGAFMNAENSIGQVNHVHKDEYDHDLEGKGDYIDFKK